MGFLEEMKNTLGEEFNTSITENGAMGYRTTEHAIVDFNYKIASYRSKSEYEIIKDFEKVLLEDKILAMQFLFFIRDREQGLGERRLFRILLVHITVVDKELIKPLLPLIADYGRYDDLLELLDTRLGTDVIRIIENQLKEDIENYNNDKLVSLLAKWLPSVNASNSIRKKQARLIYKNISEISSEKEYRKILSKLRKYIDVTEVKMCENKWDEIKYEKVPSRANLNYNAAFLKHDEERRRDFLGQVEKGEKKIHAGKLYPHDIVHKYFDNTGYRQSIKSYDTTLEELWKALPKKEISNTLVVADGSGSMTSTIGNTNITALDVANALAIYFAEHNKGEFNNTYITFSETPQLVSFKKEHNLHGKIRIALAHDEVANTNIKAVFELILQTAIKNDLKQDEMPQNILIISDMEFDSATTHRTDAKLFKSIENNYSNAGYKLPKLIFWNVNSRTTTIPLKSNELGVALASGFSTNIAEMVMSDKLDPLEILLDKLNTPRYLKIREILQNNFTK